MKRRGSGYGGQASAGGGRQDAGSGQLAFSGPRAHRAYGADLTCAVRGEPIAVDSLACPTPLKYDHVH